MAHFISDKCIGCSLCIKYCPVDAILGQKKNQHKVNEVRCVDCGVCGKVCPKNAIFDNNKNNLIKVHKEKWLNPEINLKECSGCSLCVDICKFECLQISMPKFRGDINAYAYLVNSENCVGCSMCEDVCPLHLIEMKERK